MKKLLKVLFGRPTIIAITIILQILLLYSMLTVIEQYNVFVRTASVVIALMTLVNLINRDMLPEGKLTWAIIVLALPLMGVLLYLLFSKNVLSRKQYRLLKRIDLESFENMRDDLPTQQALRLKTGKLYGQAKHIAVSSKVTMHTDTLTRYFASGEDFWQDLVEELQKAKKFIFLEYFIIERGDMWDTILAILEQKVNEGVEVRVMYDDIGCISKIPSNYCKKLRQKGIRCVKFNKFRPLLSAVHNNRDHRKITIIDGIVGYMGGINLADEYINHTHPYGYWKDTAVKLVGQGVKNMTLMYLQLYNMHSKRVEDFNPYIPQEYPVYPDEGVVVPFGDGPRPHYKEMVAEQAYIDIITQATKSLYITTPYLIPTYRLTQALRNAAQRGVDVNIVTPGIPDKKVIYMLTRYNYRALREVGVKIYHYTPGFIHSKTILADDTVAIVGTINLDYRSLIHHYECGVWMYNTRAVQQLKDDLLHTIEVSQLQRQDSLNALQRIFCRLLMLFTPLL